MIEAILLEDPREFMEEFLDIVRKGLENEPDKEKCIVKQLVDTYDRIRLNFVDGVRTPGHPDQESTPYERSLQDVYRIIALSQELTECSNLRGPKTSFAENLERSLGANYHVNAFIIDTALSYMHNLREQGNELASRILSSDSFLNERQVKYLRTYQDMVATEFSLLKLIDTNTMRGHALGFTNLRGYDAALMTEVRDLSTQVDNKLTGNSNL